jgi:5-(carboxyamino)imidazole ribonucleotide mutase
MLRKVAVLMGSKNDLPKIDGCVTTLRALGLPHEVHVMSAHRTPDTVAAFVSAARDRGFGVIIAAAGGAAHLAGVVAAHTLLPVIGIPVEGGALNGLDALLATVQMPAGIPVATVALGSGGATNAALLAAQILALGDEDLSRRLQEHRTKQRATVEAADREVSANYA